VSLPFDAPQWFAAIGRYHAAWPWAPTVLMALAFAFLGGVLGLKPRRQRVLALVLAALWLWAGMAFHALHLTAATPAAWAFAVLFAGSAAAFAWQGAVRGRLYFALPAGWRTWAGAALVAAALVLHPLAHALLGHAHPATPSFGTPSALVLFTLGVLLWLQPPAPRAVWVAPLLWAGMGGAAAAWLGLWPDLALLVAAALALAARSRSQPTVTSPAHSPPQSAAHSPAQSAAGSVAGSAAGSVAHSSAGSAVRPPNPPPAPPPARG